MRTQGAQTWGDKAAGSAQSWGESPETNKALTHPDSLLVRQNKCNVFKMQTFGGMEALLQYFVLGTMLVNFVVGVHLSGIMFYKRAKYPGVTCQKKVLIVHVYYALKVVAILAQRIALLYLTRGPASGALWAETGSPTCRLKGLGLRARGRRPG